MEGLAGADDDAGLLVDVSVELHLALEGLLLEVGTEIGPDEEAGVALLVLDVHRVEELLNLLASVADAFLVEGEVDLVVLLIGEQLDRDLPRGHIRWRRWTGRRRASQSRC